MPGIMMKYFVLKPAGDDAYASASRIAMLAYAKHIKDTNPDLCRDLTEWADHEHAEYYARKANACLISAAPKMLEALKLVRESGLADEYGASAVEDAIDAAIQKATGLNTQETI
jgi:hypothetical protein